MISNYAQCVGSLHECGKFMDIIELPENEIYYYASRYFFQIQQYLEFFPNESVHVMTLEDLAVDPRHEIRRNCTFLDLDPDGVPEESFKRRLNRTQDKRMRNIFGRLFYPPQAQQWLNGKIPWKFRIALERITTWRGRSMQKTVISPTERERWAQRFREDFRKLREFTGIAFDNWKSVEYLQ